MSRVLDVYLHEILAGKLLQEDTGQLSFHYDDAYIASKGLPISLSMPLSATRYGEKIARPFFSGLLPDDVLRHRLARYLGVSEKNPFALLEVIGGECAGALALYKEGQMPPLPQADDIEPLDDRRLGEMLALLKRRPLIAGDGQMRLSLAGAQDKMAVAVVENRIALVRGSTPTSHILKPAIEDIKDSVQNEVFCLRLAGMVGITVPNVSMHWHDKTPYFLIERYDRTYAEGVGLKRLHQEDFCQALSVPPELKYEREGGPTALQCLEVLKQYSPQTVLDQASFIKRLIFNYLIGNADAHGKNYSLLYQPGSRNPTLAPAYDLLCTAIYPLSQKMAMKIGSKYDPSMVLLRHWHSLLPDTVAAKAALTKELATMALSCIEKTGPLQFQLASEGIASPILDEICTIIHARAEHLLRQI
jgi:serine/threonine-protein kinase HipA